MINAVASPSRSLNVLVVDDEAELRESVSRTMQRLNHRVTQAGTGEAAIEILQSTRSARAESAIAPFELVILDVCMPGMSGLEVLREIRRLDPSIIVLLITAHGNIRDAVEAMREGAYDYIEKPVHDETLIEILAKANEAHRLVETMSLSSPKITLENGEQFIGGSRRMRSVFEVISRLGNVNTSVLIRGENGTGKELVAQAIHYNSSRKDKPFVAVNCGAIPEALIESEFFGHEKGAFTGADARKIGKFQFAEGGTLLLDEIGDLSPAMQVKLLRVLQERKFVPVGSHRELRCDVRIIAATNHDLEAMMKAGTFRQDLFYRLNVMPVELPPLRERADDIADLVAHFIAKFNEQHGRLGQPHEIRGVDDSALQLLLRYRWPGNIRELENVVERAFVLENGVFLTSASLPATLAESVAADAASTSGLVNAVGVGLPSPLSGALSLGVAGVPGAAPTGGPAGSLDYHDQKEKFERDFIIQALKRFRGRINLTVAHAGIPKNTLLRKIRKYRIRPSEYGKSEPKP